MKMLVHNILLIVASYLTSIASTSPLPHSKSNPRNPHYKPRTQLPSSEIHAGHHLRKKACVLDGVETNVRRSKVPRLVPPCLHGLMQRGKFCARVEAPDVAELEILRKMLCTDEEQEGSFSNVSM